MSSERLAPSHGKRGAPALSAHSLGKRFGDRVAFEDVSLEIGNGEVFALGLGAALLADCLGWRIVSPMFDRERLVTGRQVMRCDQLSPRRAIGVVQA